MSLSGHFYWPEPTKISRYIHYGFVLLCPWLNSTGWNGSAYFTVTLEKCFTWNVYFLNRLYISSKLDFEWIRITISAKMSTDHEWCSNAVQFFELPFLTSAPLGRSCCTEWPKKTVVSQTNLETDRLWWFYFLFFNSFHPIFFWCTC